MKLTWQHTVIVIVLILVMGTLAFLEKGFDVVGLLGVLAALGFIANRQAENTATTQAVKEQTNGNITTMLQMLKEQGALLAKMQPPPPDDKMP